MKEVLLLFIIGCCLSVDAFSLSTIIGLYNIDNSKVLKTSITVGIFHFIMPLIGVLISNQLNKIIILNTNLILGIILLIIALEMCIEYIKPTKKNFTLNNIGIIIFAFGVSLDSLSVGIGLSAITNNLLLSSSVFSLCSFSFTLLGLTIGKYINKLSQQYSYLLGTVILFILGIYFICKSI